MLGSVGSDKPRRLKKFILLVIAGGVAVALVSGGLLLLQSRTVDHFFEDGNKKYDRAFFKLDAGLDDLGQIKIETGDYELEWVAQRILKKTRAAQNDLSGAVKDFRRMRRTAFTGWESRAAKDAYASAVQAVKGTRELERKVKQFSIMAVMLKKVNQASDRFNEGFGKTNDAISAGNEDRFSQAKQDALMAKRLFSEAKALIEEANGMTVGADLKPLVAVLDKAVLWAAQSEQMADVGAAGRLDEYNRLAAENNRLSDEVAKSARTPALTDPAGWMNDRLDAINKTIQDHFEQADDKRERALKVWRQNT